VQLVRGSFLTSCISADIIMDEFWCWQCPVRSTLHAVSFSCPMPFKFGVVVVMGWLMDAVSCFVSLAHVR
jgi:hypothetical protein